MMNKSMIKTVWVLLTIIIFTGSVFLPSIGMNWIDVAYADESDDDDILFFIPAILAGARKAERPPLRVSAPNGGETLKSGTWYDITWTSSSLIKTVDIELSTNSGVTYPNIIVKGIPSDGSYTWGPVPFHDAGRLGSTFKIRIKDSENPNTVMDESDGIFSIQEADSPMETGQLESMNDDLAMDPYEKDSDGDWLYDNVELYLGTDPLKWDSDLDGRDDYFEVFEDVFNNLPVPDADVDGIISALDNDDDNDGVNDGRSLDSDGDGIPNYLETYGFIYVSTAPLSYYLWDGDISKSYFKTNPFQRSTDQDLYSDSMEVTKINMDLTVDPPGDNPMITAFPNFVVKMTDYTVTLNSQLTETDGTVHTDASTWEHTLEESTSTTDEWHWEVGTEISASLLDFGASVTATYGESHSTTKTTGNARSKGGEMSTAMEWSRATCTNPSEAALIKLNLRIRNEGTCVAQSVRVTMNLQIGGKNIKTMTHPEAPDTIPRILPGEYYDWVSDSYPLTMDELRALRTGAVVKIEVTSLSADVVKKSGDTYEVVGDWGTYFAAAENTSAHLFMDLGDGNTTEHLVYAGEEQWEPKVTLRDALIWAANGYETAEGPYIRFYQPDGSHGDPAPLDGWYFSLDMGTYDDISSYINNPDFNFFDTVLNYDSTVVAKAPPINPTPKIHWGVLSPQDGKVTAYVDDYFFNQDYLTVQFIDKYGTSSLMTWDAVSLYFTSPSPLNADGTAYVKDGTEKIRARNSTPQGYRGWQPVCQRQVTDKLTKIRAKVALSLG